MIDAHCHLEHIEDVNNVIKESRLRGMKAIVTSVADIKDKEKMLLLRKGSMDFIFVCLGFHPEVMKDYKDNEIDKYLDFIREHKSQISSIGEVGLDFNWNVKTEDQTRSKEIFRKFIELSKELKLPLVIHSRNGRDNKEGRNEGIVDAIEMLKNNNCKDVMMHCFSGSEGQLKTCLEQGWIISFATVICKSFKHQRLAKITPLDQMVLETDSPWLDPDSQPGSKELTNRPWKIEKSAEVLAGILDMTKKEILQKTGENAKRFFGIK